MAVRPHLGRELDPIPPASDAPRTGPVFASGAGPGNAPADPVARPRIYQLFVRLFGNTNPSRKPNGTLAENGSGRFADIDGRALDSLRALGVTHVWLHGVLRQATATDWSRIGLPPDDPDLLKGLAGSPYAVRDCFDVCPDYAVDPARRLDEFRGAVARIHDRGMKVLVDFVPNHVARSHRSVVRPELSFGATDDPSRFFAPGNNFYYMPGNGPLRLPTVRDGEPTSPTCRVVGGCDGLFGPEREHGRVTGNNVVSWSPGAGDWYETVKLNYGHDFTRGSRGPGEYPTAGHPDKPIPDTWSKMDAVLAHWQGLGVDGFRCDMAHWIPMEFWGWAIGRARSRVPGTEFIAEAYDDDPNKVSDGNVLEALLDAGFDAVYDHHAYRILKEIYDGPKWANDLDAVLGKVAPLHRAVRYAENHDEVRLANPSGWAGIGADVGRPVTALLFGIGRGPVMVYNGQEVGEPAIGSAGFGGDNGRTSIFDYGSMPEFAKWVNGHRYDGANLSGAQRELREWYGRLMRLAGDPAMACGEFIPLNSLNIDNPAYGRLPGEGASGHWLYAYIRHDPGTRRTMLVVVNLHPRSELAGIVVRFGPDALAALGAADGNRTIRFGDRLAARDAVATESTAAGLRQRGLGLPPLPPLTAWYLEAT